MLDLVRKDFARLDLRDVDVYVVSAFKDRRSHLQQKLSDFKINFIDSPIADPYMVAVSIGMLRILENKNIRCPFLILEDDVSFGKGFSREVDIPLNADCVYLGICLAGSTASQPYETLKDGCISRKYANNVYRIYNMVSHHAVLYLTESYRKAVIDAMLRSIVVCEHSDQHVAQIHGSYNVYGYSPAYFIQGMDYHDSDGQWVNYINTNGHFKDRDVGDIIRTEDFSGNKYVLRLEVTENGFRWVSIRR